MGKFGRASCLHSNTTADAHDDGADDELEAGELGGLGWGGIVADVAKGIFGVREGIYAFTVSRCATDVFGVGEEEALFDD